MKTTLLLALLLAPAAAVLLSSDNVDAVTKKPKKTGKPKKGGGTPAGDLTKLGEGTESIVYSTPKKTKVVKFANHEYLPNGIPKAELDKFVSQQKKLFKTIHDHSDKLFFDYVDLTPAVESRVNPLTSKAEDCFVQTMSKGVCVSSYHRDDDPPDLFFQQEAIVMLAVLFDMKTAELPGKMRDWQSQNLNVDLKDGSVYLFDANYSPGEPTDGLDDWVTPGENIHAYAKTVKYIPGMETHDEARSTIMTVAGKIGRLKGMVPAFIEKFERTAVY